MPEGVGLTSGRRLPLAYHASRLFQEHILVTLLDRPDQRVVLDRGDAAALQGRGFPDRLLELLPPSRAVILSRGAVRRERPSTTWQPTWRTASTACATRPGRRGGVPGAGRGAGGRGTMGR